MSRHLLDRSYAIRVGALQVCDDGLRVLAGQCAANASHLIGNVPTASHTASPQVTAAAVVAMYASVATTASALANRMASTGRAAAAAANSYASTDELAGQRLSATGL